MTPRDCPDMLPSGACGRRWGSCRYDIGEWCTRCPDCAGDGHAIVVIDSGHRGACDVECQTCLGGGHVPRHVAERDGDC